jgi:excisionase family DNA binding protein
MARSKTTFTSSVPDRPLSIDELCEWLNISRRYVNHEMAKGNLRRCTMGKNLVRLLPADINEWILSKRKAK